MPTKSVPLITIIIVAILGEQLPLTIYVSTLPYWEKREPPSLSKILSIKDFPSKQFRQEAGRLNTACPYRVKT